MKRSTICPIITVTLISWAVFAARAQVLFEDNFDTDTSTNWSLWVGHYEGEAADDYQIDWAYDYQDQTYRLFTDETTFQEFKVPPAPNGGRTTKGLRLTVNKNDGVAARCAINLYAKGRIFSGDYVLRFDAFMNHGSYSATGFGTTEYVLFGINHVGDKVNWGALASGIVRDDFVANAVGRDKSDGLWFGYTGDGGAAQDFWTWEGAGNAAPVYLAGTAGGIADHDHSGSADLGDQDGYNRALFPVPPFEAAGVPGKRWVQVEVSQIRDRITWKMDGQVVATRTNTSQWKAGTVMIGYCDPFPSIAALLDENWVMLDNLRVEQVTARTITVDSVDNSSVADDGRTSLKEALEQARPYDTIAFNIPGAGPHVIVTPLGGYPLITNNSITIDGYTQPGATPNSKAVLEGNNAVLKIVLDSTGSESTGDPAKPHRRSTRLPFPGYGDSENAVLGLYGARDVTIRGLSFQSRHTPGMDEDPAIYSIALVNGATGCRVQGNWFGLHPDGTTVKGGAAAVAAFRHRVQAAEQQNLDTFSERFIAGTDSDGVDDIAEGNIFCGHHIALALELPMNRTAGNYFNVLPNGRTFLKVDEIHAEQLAAGRAAEASSVENYENGRSTDSSVIGTDGNGVNDAQERNVLNTVVYGHWIEFYSNARNCVIAGNYFGVGIDGTSTPVASDIRDPDLIELPGNNASLRLGSNGDGTSDDLEGNLIVKAEGARIVGAGKDVLLTIRRNTMTDNLFAAFPFPNEGDRRYDQYYASVLTSPSDAIPTLTKYENKRIAGKLPVGVTDSYPKNVVDIYVADAAADARGVIMPGRWLASFVEGSEADLDPAEGQFEFDLASVPVPPVSKILIAVTYGRNDLAGTESGLSVTGPASNALPTGGQPAAPISLAAPTRVNNQLSLSWSGGTGPFKVQQKNRLSDAAWTDVTSINDRSFTVSLDGAAGFFRIVGAL